MLQPITRLFLIFWGPPTLQNGNPTGFSASYIPVTVKTAVGYAGHGLANNNTQYYQTISGTTTYISSLGGAAGLYYDSSAFPSSGCSDAATPGQLHHRRAESRPKSQKS